MTTAPPISEQILVARLERLPMSSWHNRMRVALGVATFFDGFDALAIAFALPALIGLWNIEPAEVGVLIAAGFVGQAVGAVGFGALAERFGRVRVARIAIALFGLMSLVCATADSYMQLLVLRFIQGLGLGGYMPIAATYINEIAPAKRRGRFFMLYESIFILGVLAVAAMGAWLVPRLGWESLFIIGGAPALIAIVVQHFCPESPRWLASRGRLEEADRVVRRIEDVVSKNGRIALPPVTAVAAQATKKRSRWTELFHGAYRKRTLTAWALWFLSFVVTFGLSTWLPSLYRTQYGLSVQDALNYSLIANAVGLAGALVCAFTIDRLGRRTWFAGSFFLCSLPLFALWFFGASDLTMVVLLASLGSFWIYAAGSALYLYTTEIYPTRIRAIGIGWSSFWLRVASVISPIAIGYALPLYGSGMVFLLFAMVAAVGAVVSFLGIVETRGRVLEEISP